ncbi:hypothetical protein A9Q73_07255 [Bermanella sp. 47_1433_sub80_T6]|nr:hypothetical protein A9Q73_07255 [Bermanella sp. 47_1433_sub80_T6]
MPSYQTLDNIADAYIPALAILCLCLLIKQFIARDWQRLLREGGLFVMGLVVAYTIMFVDNALLLWPQFNMDYSTHTAVALVLVITLWVMKNSLQGIWSVFLFVSLLGYFLLMLYQQYHSVADIISTSLVVGALVLPLAGKIQNKELK